MNTQVTATQVTAAQSQSSLPAQSKTVTPMMVLSQAFNNGSTVEQLSGLLDLAERYEAREAEKAFNVAMAQFSAEMPALVKDKKVSFTTDKGQTEYSHLSLANIVYTARAILGKYGLSFNWDMSQADGKIVVGCVVSHRDGHKYRVEMMSSPDTSGGKNSIQSIASAKSYLERYTLMAALGLAAYDQVEDDGRGADMSRFVTTEQCHELTAFVESQGGDVRAVISHFGFPAVEAIPATEFPKVMAALRQKAAKRAAGAAQAGAAQ